MFQLAPFEFEGGAIGITMARHFRWLTELFGERGTFHASSRSPTKFSSQIQRREGQKMTTRAAKSMAADEIAAVEDLMSEAFKKLTDEVEHRPLIMLGIAAGVGFLAGLTNQR